jgi:RNA polymerase sigma factor (sigma-70 family)
MAALPSEGHAAAVSSRFAPEGEATRLLYERHQRKILSFCKHQLGSREEAEDATQITFMNAFRGLKRGASPEFESAWLFKIAHNVCLTKQRSSYRRRLVEAPNDFEVLGERVPAYEGDTDELFGLQTALRVVPEQQRRALLLREWQGLSYKEIADEMRLSQAAVETLLFRARRSLAGALTTDPAERPKRGRPRINANFGSGVAAFKSLLIGGSVKVAATVATVAATSVVTVTPSVRHDVLDAVGQRQASRPHAVRAPVLGSLVSAPVVVLAHRATSVKPAPRRVPPKAAGVTHIVTRVTAPVVAAETQPAAPAEHNAAASAQAAPAPSDQLPSVPVPVPASAPAPVFRDVPPADPEPAPSLAPNPAPIASPSAPSTPTPQVVPSVAPAGNGLKAAVAAPNLTKSVNEPAVTTPTPAVTTPTVTTPAWVPPGQAKKDDASAAAATPSVPVQTTTQAAAPPLSPPPPASAPVVATPTSATPAPAPEWVPPGQAKKDDSGADKGGKKDR